MVDCSYLHNVIIIKKVVLKCEKNGVFWWSDDILCDIISDLKMRSVIIFIRIFKFIIAFLSNKFIGNMVILEIDYETLFVRHF